MAFYRRVKPLLHSLCSQFLSTSRVSTKALVRDCGSSSPSASAKFSGFSLHSHVSQKLSFPVWTLIAQRFYRVHGRNVSYRNTRRHITKRVYYIDGQNTRNFRARGIQGFLQNPKLLIVVVIAAGVLFTVCLALTELVPCTKRRRILPVSRTEERSVVEKIAEMCKEKCKDVMVPESVRLRSILVNIIEALHRGLGNELVLSDLDDVGSSGEGKEEGKCGSGGEVPEGKWIKRSVKKAQLKGSEVAKATSNFDGICWEACVFDSPLVIVLSIWGKFILSSGALKRFTSEAEIAAIVALEVGHLVARHFAEVLGDIQLSGIKNIAYVVIKTIMKIKIRNLKKKKREDFIYSQKMELEANYIAVLLMASAGYDPRLAVEVIAALHEDTEKDEGLARLEGYFFLHSPFKDRAQKLSQSKVMEEALMIYGETISGRQVEGFLLS